MASIQHTTFGSTSSASSVGQNANLQQIGGSDRSQAISDLYRQYIGLARDVPTPPESPPPKFAFLKYTASHSTAPGIKNLTKALINVISLRKKFMPLFRDIERLILEEAVNNLDHVKIELIFKTTDIFLNLHKQSLEEILSYFDQFVSQIKDKQSLEEFASLGKEIITDIYNSPAKYLISLESETPPEGLSFLFQPLVTDRIVKYLSTEENQNVFISQHKNFDDSSIQKLLNIHRNKISRHPK